MEQCGVERGNPGLEILEGVLLYQFVIWELKLFDTELESPFSQGSIG